MAHRQVHVDDTVSTTSSLQVKVQQEISHPLLVVRQALDSEDTDEADPHAPPRKDFYQKMVRECRAPPCF